MSFDLPLQATSVIEKVWKPNEKGQQEVLALPDSIFEALGGGAAGGGKTDLGIMLPCVRQFTEHPKFKALILRRTHTDLEKEILLRQYDWYPHMGAVYNETKKVWKFPSGARIQNGHAEREDDVRKYDSAEYNYIDWDESTHFTAFQYLYLSLSRCRSSSADLPAFVRAFTNPGNVGHGFFKERFVKPFPGGKKLLVDKVTKQKRIYIPFLGKDNPHLLHNDPNYLVRLEGLPEAEKRAKLFGDWDAYEGQVFSEFRVMRLQDEPPNAVHVIEPFTIPPWWPRILAIDWGWTAMTWAGWGAISPNGRLYLYRTAAWTKTNISIWSREIADISRDEELSTLIICHSANQHRGEEKTIQEQVFDAFEGKYPVTLGDRDRIGGKNLLHEYLRWKPRPRLRPTDLVYDEKLAARILRMSGQDKYNEYLKIFVEEAEEDNIPRLQIFRVSPEGREPTELLDAIPACVPDETNPEDVAEFPGDDPYDGIRMLVKAAHRYFDESKTNFVRMQEQERLIQKLTATQDWTAFYRNSAIMESRENADVVRRFRRRR